jgi:AraC-like DNA-binding protein
LTEREKINAGKPDTIASYLFPVVKALDSRGIDSRALLERAGIQEAISNDPLVRLPYDCMGEIFRLATEATGDPRFGLYASRYMLPSHIHALGTALLASRSLLDACLRIERFGSFLANTAEFKVESSAGVTRFGARTRVNLRPEATDMFWSFVLRFMRHLDTENLTPLRVDIPGPENPGDREAYEAFFRCPLTFDAQEMALYFETGLLAKPLDTSSEELAQLSDRVVRGYLAKMDREDIVSRVSSLLVANLPTGTYGKEDAAADLNMSPRTLQNKLLQASTTWRELVDGTRHDLALSCLESGRYRISEVAYMLGFNDTSSFSRAFRRWTGKPPGDYLRGDPDRASGHDAPR